MCDTQENEVETQYSEFTLKSDYSMLQVGTLVRCTVKTTLWLKPARHQYAAPLRI